ncbi:hypothetical protein V5799_011088 [Amblyomma americanum]|uniref:Uncharacterized protein n=1 Tax=Amblyomma americanum TaxID=6943 RepID=A0AAQ4EI48_AMBAM
MQQLPASSVHKDSEETSESPRLDSSHFRHTHRVQLFLVLGNASMYRLFALLVACTWAFSTIAGNEKERTLDCEREEMCKDRNTSVNLKECGRYFGTMYIYNETTRLCNELPESICLRSADEGVFYDMFTCSHTCTKGKGPESCLLGPHEPANETCTLKERLWYDHTNSCEPNKAWFYNVSSEECEEYGTCRNPQKFPVGVNGFFRPHFCHIYCGRFHINNINGSENSKFISYFYIPADNSSACLKCQISILSCTERNAPRGSRQFVRASFANSHVF